MKARRPALIKGNAEKLVSRLHKMSLADTVRMWRNAVKALANKASKHIHPDAKLVLAAIDDEWSRRRAVEPDEYFAWPSTMVISGSRTLDGSRWLEAGVLRFLGYSVGHQSELSKAERHEILSRVFVGQIPPAFPADYLAEWASPASARRLQKMAVSIAAFARHAKRRGDDRLDDAINDWETDLEFLYIRYYVGHFHFAWPSSSVI